jgi:hypothetical protein
VTAVVVPLSTASAKTEDLLNVSGREMALKRGLCWLFGGFSAGKEAIYQIKRDIYKLIKIHKNQIDK